MKKIIILKVYFLLSNFGMEIFAQSYNWSFSWQEAPAFRIKQNIRSNKYGLELWNKKEFKYSIFLEEEYDRITLADTLYNISKEEYLERTILFILEKNGESTLFKSSEYNRGVTFKQAKTYLINTDIVFTNLNYESIKIFNGIALIKKQNKFGVIQLSDNNWLLPIEFDTIKIEALQLEPKQVLKYDLLQNTYLLYAYKNNGSGIYSVRKKNWVFYNNDYKLYHNRIEDNHIETRIGNKKGLLFLQYSKSPSLFRWKEVINLDTVYEALRPNYNYILTYKNGTEQNLIIVDSSNKKGLWSWDKNKSRLSNLSYCELDSFNFIPTKEYNIKHIEVYKARNKGYIDEKGWVYKPFEEKINQKLYLNEYSILALQDVNKKIIIAQNNSNGYQSVDYRDSTDYEYFQLNNNILIAIGKTSSIFRINYTKNLAGEISLISIEPIIKNILNPNFANNNSNIVFYETNKEKYIWVLFNLDGSFFFIKPAVEGLNQILYNYFYEYTGKKNFFLVKKDSKFGVIDQYGKIAVPIENNSFYGIENKGIFFTGTDFSKRRHLNINYLESWYNKKAISKEKPYVSLRLKNNLYITDFDSIYTSKYKIGYKFNNNWYFEKNGEFVINNEILNNGIELEKSFKGFSEYTLFEKGSGIGMKYEGNIILPPYFKSLKIETINDRFYNKLTMYLLNGDSASCDLNNLNNKRVNNKIEVGFGFSICHVCKGTGLSNSYTSTEISKNYSNKSYNSVKKQETYIEYEKVYNQITRRYDNIPRTRVKEYYDIKPYDNPKTKTESITKRDNCYNCNGKGRAMTTNFCELKNEEFILSSK